MAFSPLRVGFVHPGTLHFAGCVESPPLRFQQCTASSLQLQRTCTCTLVISGAYAALAHMGVMSTGTTCANCTAHPAPSGSTRPDACKGPGSSLRPHCVRMQVSLSRKFPLDGGSRFDAAQPARLGSPFTPHARHPLRLLLEFACFPRHWCHCRMARAAACTCCMYTQQHRGIWRRSCGHHAVQVVAPAPHPGRHVASSLHVLRMFTAICSHLLRHCRVRAATTSSPHAQAVTGEQWRARALPNCRSLP